MGHIASVPVVDCIFPSERLPESSQVKKEDSQWPFMACHIAHIFPGSAMAASLGRSVGRWVRHCARSLAWK